MRHLLLILFLFFFSNISHAESIRLKIGFNSNSSYPHIIGTGSELFNPPGISVEITQHVIEQLGGKVEFERMPGLRVLKKLEENQLDAALIFSYHPEREKYGVFPFNAEGLDHDSRLTTLTYALYKRKDSPLFWDGQHFTNVDRPIGANRGYSIIKFIKSYGLEIEEAKNTAHNLQKLLAGRISAVADQDIVADFQIHKMGLDEIEKLAIPLVTKDYFLIFSHEFSKNHPAIRDAIWQKISEKREFLTKRLLPAYTTSGNY